MNNIAINKDVIEQLEKSYENVGFEHPIIDIDNDLSEFVQSLEHDSDHERKNLVTEWVEAEVRPMLSEWKGKYSQNSNLLDNANTETSKLAQAKKTDQTNITNMQSKIGDLQDKLKRKEEEIEENNRTAQKNKKIDIKYERMKAVMFLVISFIIAIGTYFYFAQAQVNIKWATMANADKVSKVKELLVDYKVRNQYSAFYDEISQDDDGDTIPLDKLSDKDLVGITVNNIYKSALPSISQYMSIDFSIIALAFSAFLLILLGKVTAIVYEKLGMPNWMYYLLYALAILVISGAVISTSSLGDKQVKRTQLINDIGNANNEVKKIEEKEEEESDTRGYEDENDENPKVINPKILELTQKIEKLNEELDRVNTSIGDFKFITMLLFMFSEIIIGSLAWIAYAEYIDKKRKLSIGAQGTHKILEDELTNIKEKIKEINENIKLSQDRMTLATNLENRLTVLKTKLYSKNEIENMAQQHLSKQISRGLTKLKLAEGNWRKGEEA